jgi:hypothetical protein
VVGPRISAAVFFAQGFVPGTLREAARQVAIPLQFLLPGATKGWNGSRPLTCSTPSAPKRRRCTPIWAGTPVPRGSRWTTRPAGAEVANEDGQPPPAAGEDQPEESRMAGAPSYWLDADSTHGYVNGTKVQVWLNNGHDNQLWHSWPAA